MATTIKDIARITGTSISTVSKALNGGNVLEPKRTEILNAAKELNYKANPIARGMKTKRTRTVGVLIPNLEDFYGVSILAQVSKCMYEYDYSTIVCDYQFVNETDTNIAEKINFLMNYCVDGIIVQPVSVKSEDLAVARNANIPVVFVDVEDKDNYHDSVVIDNKKVAYEITSQFIENGHKQIAIITGGSGASTNDDRIEGYRAALLDNGLSVIPDYVYKEDIVNEESGYRGMEKFMRLDNPPTCVFAAGHDLMTGALTYISENNISIPEDVSFIGFENRELARVFNPRLTIGMQPMDEIAKMASELLYMRMTGDKGVARKRKVNTVIEYGNSVKKLEE